MSLSRFGCCESPVSPFPVRTCFLGVFRVRRMMSSLRLAVEVASHARDVIAVRSSSFEGIYDDATPPLEGSSSESTTDVTPCDVGDRFAPARVEEEEAGALARVSSFEGLYGDGAFGKEAAHVEEKDVDELGATTDSDLDRSEKGAHEDEKFYVQSPPQMFASARSDLASDLELDLSSGRSSAAHAQSPIDVTLESGLDRVGQSDATPVEEQVSFRDRHFSTPELRRFAGAGTVACSVSFRCCLDSFLFCFIYSLCFTLKRENPDLKVASCVWVFFRF